MGKLPLESAPLVLGLLESRDKQLQGKAGEILWSMAPLPLQHMAPILAMTRMEPEQRPRWLMVAHAAGGGDPRVERSLRWLGGRAPRTFPTL
jgi:hypothetical protein